MQVTACLLLAVISVTASSALKGLDGLQVLTQQGNVAGTLVLPTVRQFLSVPYASAKRWEAPGLPPNHLSTIQATQFGDSCIQLHNAADLEFGILSNSGGFNLTESEDCLTVNIWAPSVERKQKTAVMFWVYGGAFQFGTSHLPLYDGRNFVRDNDDLVIVTFNYRLNIFGQPNAPQLQSKTVSQNFGLLDLDAAVNWVHDNIAAFGGDPNRITIFGQSAGSVATDAYAFAHPHDSIVKGIIQESGSFGTLGAQGSPSLDPTNWNTVAASVGCGTTNDAKQLACMKAVPATTLEAAVLKSNVLFNLFADNITIFADIAARSAAGNFLHAPLLGGSTLNEGDVFVIDQETLILGSAPPMITEVLADLTTQIAFTCPAGQTAQSRFNAQVPTWRYQYQAIFPDISTRPDLRAYHASEISLVFGSYNESFPAIPPTLAEVALSRFVQSAWVAFARDPQMGLLDFGWPMYNANTNTLAQIGNPANETGIVFTSGARVDLTCSAAALLLNISNQLGGLLGIGPIQI